MNRIKHTLLLALALLMSVGAWALPSYHIVGSGQGNWMHGIGWVTDAPENEMAYENGIFTITFENVQPGTHEFMFFDGGMEYGRYNTENPIQFNTSLGVYELGSSYTFELTAAADVTVTLDATNWKCMVTYIVVEQNISQDESLNWLFTMPDYDADMRLVWKAPADLAWNDVPDGGVSGYRGFHNLVTFPTLANPHSLPVRYGVTDTTIASIDNEGNIVFLAAGQTVVYAIHDFDADYDYDSVTYNLTVLTPATFTLANNEGGIFEVAAGSGSNISTWTSETWQGWNNENKTHTVDGITVTSTGSLNEYTYQVDPPYYLYMYVAGNNASKTLTFSSNSGNFTRIEMTRDTYYPTANIAPTTGWSESAQQNIWEGDAAEVTLTSCTTRVSQIVFYRAGGLSDSVIATAQPNVFEVIPGATITVLATPDSAHYLARFDEDEALNSNAPVEKTYTVAADMTATANFSSKPTLTLVNNEGGRIEAIVPQGGMTATQLTSDMVPDWEGNYGESFTEATLQAMGFVSVDSAVAAAWTGAPETGSAKLIYKFDGGNCYFLNFIDGVNYGASHDDYAKGVIYAWTTGPTPLCFTTGTTNANVMPATEENTYIVDYGTDVTVVATPDSAHYLVRFDSDSDTNSNAAVEKTYLRITSNTTSTANFTHKPLLTLNSNEGGRIEVVMPEGGVAATHLTANQIPTWQGDDYPAMEADLQQFGFVPVDSATARTWTGAPAVGEAHLLYAATGDQFKAHVFQNGQWSEAYTAYYPKGSFYAYSDIIYFTTGADMGTGNITAAAEANKYYVDYGTDVTVQATPAKHYHLAAWSRNVTPGADSTAALNMTEDQTVTATFEKNAPELAWRYRRDTMPAEGVTAYLGFTTDTIMLIGTTANDEFLMAYAEEDADLHFGSTNTNVVSFADANDPMSITVNGVGTTTIYMVHNGSLMAYDSVTFPVTILQPATLTIAANGNGTLVVDTVSDSIITTATEGRYHVVHGANINLTSTPADKHYMQTWNDVDTAINSNVVVNRTITVTSDTTITATFAHKPIITLASSDTAWGSVKVQLTNYEQLPEGVVVMEGFENRYIIDYGLRVTLVATATEMHHVSHWVDQNVDSLFAAIYREYFVTDPVDLYPATSRLSFIVTVDTTAKAIFGVNCFDVDASVAPHSFSGTAEITYIDVVDSTLSTGANAVVHAVAKGSTTATITATPATGYHFVGWKDNMNDETDTLITENPVSVNVMTNYTAVFDTNVYDITVNIDSIEGSVEGPATVKHFLRGTYTATATPCYHFVNWTNEAGDTISTNPTLTIAAISDSAVTANFELNIYTGDTTAVECDQFVWHGITYTATPEEEPTFVYKNHNNCDSTVTLHLTINYHHDTTIYRQASGGFTFLDNYYTENTTDTLTIETVLHCDSNITLVLAVLPHTTPLPVIYNLMDVALTIDHFEGDTGHIDYIFYRWYKDGAIVSEGIDMDSYSEEGTILNGCYHLEISTDEDHQYWATSNEICVGTTGIDDVEAITLTVAPNPVMHGNKANITVNGAANLQGATATVFDAQGRKVLEFGVQNSIFEIQTSTLPSGIYTVRIVLSDGRMATRKLVVR